MNEPTPQWRSFSSAAPQPPTPAPRPRAPEPDPPRSWHRWLVPALVAAGGLVGGVLAIALAAVALLVVPAAPTDDAFGEPLELLPAGAGVTTETTAVAEIVVDVAGAVVRPGLHRLPAGARVGDAVAAAGGFGPRADLAASSEQLNLAQSLEDGAKVLVPELGVGPARDTSAAGEGRIDINSADQAELESLPGIGPVTAGKIVTARGERRFDSVRELRTRGLVGEKVYADIKDRVSIS